MQFLQSVERKIGNVGTIFQTGQVFHHYVHPMIIHKLHQEVVPGYARMLARGDAIGGFLLKSNEHLNDFVIQCDIQGETKKQILLTASKFVGKMDTIGSINLKLYQTITEYALNAKEVHDFTDIGTLYLSGPIITLVAYVSMWKHTKSPSSLETFLGRMALVNICYSCIINQGITW